jgi:protein import protein ZIM17
MINTFPTTTTHLFHTYNNGTMLFDSEKEGEPLSGEEENAIILERIEHVKKHTVATIECYMAAEFKCGKCGADNAHVFSKAAYESGEVIVRCPGCKHLHLIADNKGWFGSERNIEEILKAKGESVRRLNINDLTEEEKKTRNLLVIQEMIERREERKRQRILAEEQKLKKLLDIEAEEELEKNKKLYEKKPDSD